MKVTVLVEEYKGVVENLKVFFSWEKAQEACKKAWGEKGFIWAEEVGNWVNKQGVEFNKKDVDTSYYLHKAALDDMEDSGIFPYLDCSTGHIPLKDANLLAVYKGALPVYPYPEGFWVHVCEDDDDNVKTLRKAGFSKSFLNVLAFARSKGCYFLRLDSDGKTYSELKQHSWL